MTNNEVGTVVLMLLFGLAFLAVCIFASGKLDNAAVTITRQTQEIKMQQEFITAQERELVALREIKKIYETRYGK